MLVQTRNLIIGQLVRAFERGQTGRMQDLVGIRVTDAAEQARIRQRAFEGMVLARQRLAKGFQRASHDLDAPWIVLEEIIIAAHNVNGCAFLRSGFSEKQRPPREIKRSQSEFLRNFLVAPTPSEPAGNHEVYDQKEFVSESEHDALAQAPDRLDGLPFQLLNGRIDRSQDERAREAHRHEGLAHEVSPKRLDVDDDIRQFGHGLAL